MKTLILLIDFYGHPALTTDRYNDSIRYSALTEIISSSYIDRTNCAIFSTSIPQNDERLLELKKMAILKGFPFVTPIPGTNSVPWDEIYSIDYIKSKLKDFINIDKTDTQIIVTGTNTSGCVYKSKSIGAYHWSKAGFKTKIYLPMTIEYEQKGINDLERNINGFATLYNEIKKDKCFDIDIVKNFTDLKLPV